MIEDPIEQPVRLTQLESRYWKPWEHCTHGWSVRWGSPIPHKSRTVQATWYQPRKHMPTAKENSHAAAGSERDEASSLTSLNQDVSHQPRFLLQQITSN